MLRVLMAAGLCAAGGVAPACSPRPLPQPDGPPTASTPDVDPSMRIGTVTARYASDIDAVLLSLRVAGDAASTAPDAVGQVDGAPVLGYVFVTDLPPEAVGFGTAEGTLALAVTSHPDFDDTPLWDEDGNATYDDDGAVYHAHWVVLAPDARAAAGVGVGHAPSDATLPPSAPMPMWLDSPGFTVVEQGPHLRVIVPADRIQRRLDFRVGALSAAMHVALQDGPRLEVDAVLSQVGDGSPQTRVQGGDAAPDNAWPRPLAPTAPTPGTLRIADADARYLPELGTFVFSMTTQDNAATFVPKPTGGVDGAPVTGYVWPTDLPPATVGFAGEGTLALAVTSHPDFDDTPLWDESLNGDPTDDGAVYHVHWVVLSADEDAPAGLVVQSETDRTRLPPTAPMPMRLDSPGFHAFARGGQLRVLVPAWQLRGMRTFGFDALTAHMRVDASGPAPTLRVERVISRLGTGEHMPLHAAAP